MDWNNIKRWSKFYVIFSDETTEELNFDRVISENYTALFHSDHAVSGKVAIRFTDTIHFPFYSYLFSLEDYGKTWQAYEVV